MAVDEARTELWLNQTTQPPPNLPDYDPAPADGVRVGESPVPGLLVPRFIQDEEIPRLLQRRLEEGMRVIPIIIRPCMWQSEPVLSDLQALPTDRKAVISFPEHTGERDQVWTDIAKAIENRAKALQSGVE